MMGQNLSADEPVADDVQGHGVLANANEPVVDDDVEGHGLIRNVAIAAALTVGGGVAMASPASAGETTTAAYDDSTTTSEDSGRYDHEALVDAGCYDAYGNLDEQCAEASGVEREDEESSVEASTVPSEPDAGGWEGYSVDGANGVSEYLAKAYDASVSAEKLKVYIWEDLPAELREKGSAEDIGDYVWHGEDKLTAWADIIGPYYYATK